MPLLSPSQDDGNRLPGLGLHVDTEVRRCPDCRGEAMPWELACPACGAATVRPDELPASELSHLDLATLELDDPDGPDGPAEAPDDGRGDEDSPA